MDDRVTEAVRCLEKLRDHALGRLPDMIDGDERLFSFRSRALEQGWVNEGVSIRYSAIALLGLLEARKRGLGAELDLPEMIERLFSAYHRTPIPGDIGLTLWVGAEAMGQDLASRGRVEEILRRLLTTMRKESAKPTRVIDTMELSWILVALVRARKAGLGESIPPSLFEEACVDLALNFDERSSLFHFRRVDRRGRPPRRKRLSFFAEQAYGILALAEYSGVTGDERALREALACAKKLVSLQSPRGGWPWRYHAPRGVVAETFPLFSVHQDGMAPLALARLASVSGMDFLEPISRSILWIEGRNEMGLRLYNERLGIIWRAIRRKGPLRVLSEANKALSLVGVDSVRIVDRIFPLYEVVPETRSYHMGWILCAWSALEELIGASGERRPKLPEEEPRR